ncbi:TPA: helix-turn-helix domain-containing protein, partial [Serratia marcescens]
MISKNEMPLTILAIWGQNILTSGWTTIPNLLLKSQSKLGLSNSELVLVIHLISFIHQPFSRVFPSIELLSKRMDQDRRTIQRTMKRLEDKGIVRKKVRSTGKVDVGMTNVYDLDPLMLKLIKIQLPTIDSDQKNICNNC